MRQHARPSGKTDRFGPPTEEHAAPDENPLAPVVAGTVVPTIDLRIVLFTVAGGRLWVALHDQDGASRLPGGTPNPERSLDAEARRLARETTGLREQYLEQLYTLGVPARPFWTVMIGYLGLIGSASDDAPSVTGGWRDIERLPILPAADRMMTDYALVRLRAKLGYTTIAFHLLPPAFTIGELQGAYEVILDRCLDKRNFRRRVVAAGLLESTGEQRRDGSHRPALLYRFRATEDRGAYLTPPWAESA